MASLLDIDTSKSNLNKNLLCEYTKTSTIFNIKDDFKTLKIRNHIYSWKGIPDKETYEKVMNPNAASFEYVWNQNGYIPYFREKYNLIVDVNDSTLFDKPDEYPLIIQGTGFPKYGAHIYNNEIQYGGPNIYCSNKEVAINKRNNVFNKNDFDRGLLKNFYRIELFDWRRPDESQSVIEWLSQFSNKNIHTSISVPYDYPHAYMEIRFTFGDFKDIIKENEYSYKLPLRSIYNDKQSPISKEIFVRYDVDPELSVCGIFTIHNKKSKFFERKNKDVNIQQFICGMHILTDDKIPKHLSGLPEMVDYPWKTEYSTYENKEWKRLNDELNAEHRAWARDELRKHGWTEEMIAESSYAEKTGGNKQNKNNNVSVDKNGKLRLKLDGHSYIIQNEKNRYYVMKGGNKVSCTKEVNSYNKNKK